MSDTKRQGVRFQVIEIGTGIKGSVPIWSVRRDGKHLAAFTTQADAKDYVEWLANKDQVSTGEQVSGDGRTRR